MTNECFQDYCHPYDNRIAGLHMTGGELPYGLYVGAPGSPSNNKFAGLR